MGRTFTKEELNEILERHQHWAREDCDGWETMKADLCGADLRGANLCGADLSEANLCGADLCRANLCGADLSEANLCDATLCDATLCGADLCGADLCEADLSEVDLRGAKNVPFIPMACPDTGSFTGWKKALTEYEKPGSFPIVLEVIIELEIPADARRSSATTRKCRCDKAIVKSITSINGIISFDTAFSRYNENFVYEVGKEVSVDNFNEDRFKECAPGIHFFINRQEAVEY